MDDICIVFDFNWFDLFDNGGWMNDGDWGLVVDLWMFCQGLKDMLLEDRCFGYKVVEYCYVDEVGKLVYVVVCCLCKLDGCLYVFVQWIFDVGKRFGKKWGLFGLVWCVFYNLLRVIEVVKVGWCIWIMEGEKDVDWMGLDFFDEVVMIVVLGVGKSKWKLEYIWYFKGVFEVIIVVDCDKMGLEFVEEVYGYVSKIVGKVKVVCLLLMSDGVDFFDYWDYGFGFDEFEVVFFVLIKKCFEMKIVVEEEYCEKKVVFGGFSQEFVEWSLVGLMFWYGNLYGINEVDFQMDVRMNVIVKVVVRLVVQEMVIMLEMVVVEIEDMGVSIYDKVIFYVLELEVVVFDDMVKLLIVVCILWECMMWWILMYISWVIELVFQDEWCLFDQILIEVGRMVEKLNEEYVLLEKEYCGLVGDVFIGDVFEEIVMDEIEQLSNVCLLWQVQLVVCKEWVVQGG